MKITALAQWTASLLLAAALGACGGGNENPDAPPPPPAAGTVVGPSGGTVTGPNGSKIVIPPGALATDTPINIEQSSAGAPALPGGFVVLGQMFAFTPHGTTFAVPVTLTLPFDPSGVPAGQAPTLLKTNAQSQWESVAGATFGASTVTAQITSFSNGQVGIEPIDRPFRDWKFKIFTGDGQGPFTQPPLDGSGTQEGGVLDQLFDFGKAFFDLPYVSKGFSHDPDSHANGLIMSSARGTTFGVFTEAPNAAAHGTNPIGSVAELTQLQSFRKITADASMTFTITDVIIAATDFQAARFHVNIPDPNFLISGEVYFEVRAYKSGNEFFRKAGRASIHGNGDVWTPQAFPDGGSRSELWNIGNFSVTVLPIFSGRPGEVQGCKGNGATLTLREPLTHSINLSSVGEGEEFTLAIITSAQAINRRGNGTGNDCLLSSANAFLRDPLEIGGTALTSTGLEPTNRPAPLPAAQPPVSPASCVPGSNGAAGVLQFDAANYLIGEFSGMVPVVKVTRTGGTSGEVTATFSTGDGSAIAGTDYTPVNFTVFFGDGETTPRVITVPTLQNQVIAPDKTVNLTLSQPGGCATLGAQNTAVLTIHDDAGESLPPPPMFTVGGTVSGLVGTGLVLRDLTFVPISPANGAFTFPVPTGSGSPYAVTVLTQPSNPLQVCSVINGSGTVAGANITNVLVDCVTPPPSGGLDASFGPGGKVTTPSTGIANAVALQSDGKIVTAGGPFTLTRHNPDGSIDAGFGTNGKVTTAFGSGSGLANDVAVQGDGKIVVAGSTRARAGFSNDDDFALRRYNPDGSLDTTFGTGGIVSTDFAALADSVTAVAIQSDGKIVVAGQAQGPSGTDLGLARYNADGSLDATFGINGKLITDVAGGFDFTSAMRLQPDGAIVVLARISLAGSNVIGTQALVRYSTSGSLDAAFGTGGKVIGGGNAPVNAMALQGDGSILVAGSINAGSSSSAFGLMRFFSNGSVDSAFGTVSTAFFTSGNGTIGRGVAVQSDGRIVLIGEAASGASSTFDLAIARYDANGSLDNTFGTGGKLLVDFFGGTDSAGDVVVQADGKIVIAGTARNGGSSEFALVRANR